MNETDDARKLLLDEYKLVQDKIDKFGAFKFVIRGWAMTLTSAMVGAIATAASPSPSALFVLPILLLFWALEAYELRTRVLLSSRALRIESALRKTGPAPETAGWLATNAIARRKEGRFLNSIHDLFYVVLLIMVGGAFAVRYFHRPPAQPAPLGYDITISAPSAEPQPNKPHTDVRAPAVLPRQTTTPDGAARPAGSEGTQ